MFGRKKTTAIDKRLQELQREMAEVGSKIKSLSSAGRAPATPGRSIVPVPRLGMFETEPPPASPSPTATTPEDERGVQEPAAGQGPVLPSGAGDLPLFEPRGPVSPTGREKFASYFMAGHFPNLRPIRQEKRIVRNKAIIMLILVVLALVWLIYFL